MFCCLACHGLLTRITFPCELLEELRARDKAQETSAQNKAQVRYIQESYAQEKAQETSAQEKAQERSGRLW